MKYKMEVVKWMVCIFALYFVSFNLNAKDININESLTEEQQSIISIAALTANGDLQ